MSSLLEYNIRPFCINIDEFYGFSFTNKTIKLRYFDKIMSNTEMQSIERQILVDMFYFCCSRKANCFAFSGSVSENEIIHKLANKMLPYTNMANGFNTRNERKFCIADDGTEMGSVSENEIIHKLANKMLPYINMANGFNTRNKRKFCIGDDGTEMVHLPGVDVCIFVADSSTQVKIYNGPMMFNHIDMISQISGDEQSSLAALALNGRLCLSAKPIDNNYGAHLKDGECLHDSTGSRYLLFCCCYSNPHLCSYAIDVYARYYSSGNSNKWIKSMKSRRVRDIRTEDGKLVAAHSWTYRDFLYSSPNGMEAGTLAPTYDNMPLWHCALGTRHIMVDGGMTGANRPENVNRIELPERNTTDSPLCVNEIHAIDDDGSAMIISDIFDPLVPWKWLRYVEPHISFGENQSFFHRIAYMCASTPTKPCNGLYNLMYNLLPRIMTHFARWDVQTYGEVQTNVERLSRPLSLCETLVGEMKCATAMGCFLYRSFDGRKPLMGCIEDISTIHEAKPELRAVLDCRSMLWSNHMNICNAIVDATRSNGAAGSPYEPVAWNNYPIYLRPGSSQLASNIQLNGNTVTQSAQSQNIAQPTPSVNGADSSVAMNTACVRICMPSCTPQCIHQQPIASGVNEMPSSVVSESLAPVIPQGFAPVVYPEPVSAMPPQSVVGDDATIIADEYKPAISPQFESILPLGTDSTTSSQDVQRLSQFLGVAPQASECASACAPTCSVPCIRQNIGSSESIKSPINATSPPTYVPIAGPVLPAIQQPTKDCAADCKP
uniref:PNPLA domain-containing protein n=1 Tax=Ascaris lumbricoides TaxID=6252 RepID=A0A9J2Q9P1_ASCLU